MNLNSLAACGVILTAVGIIVGIARPLIGARWAGPETARREWWLARRYYLSVAMIVVGTLLQLPALLA
jgi:hypothetical protein